jgi:RNA 3'-terminal phosphate cyclase (ATP)
MLEIDGSLGEGGGQILRTALSLSCVLRKPFRIFNIRRGRKKPGLMPQHLACVRALASTSHAQVKGDLEGSGELVFEPGETEPGDYSFDIGTAGSTSLLLQATLPPLAFAGERSLLTLRGGTHVPCSPPFHFVSEVFIPMLRRLGIRISASIERYGFYPKGGGEIRVGIEPVARVKAMNVSARGEIERISGISGVVNLSEDIAVRQRRAALERLSDSGLKASIGLFRGEASGRGTFVFLRSDAEACPAGFSSLGERGKRAETVGEEAARDLLDYYHTGACLDYHLADQIVLYLALAEGGSSFTVSRITSHLLANLGVIERFLGVKYRLEGKQGRSGT